MCYASPGPRCEKHARDRFNATRNKTNIAESKVQDAENSLNDYKKKNPDDTSSEKFQKLTKEHESSLKKFKEAKQKQALARDDMDATKGGQHKLRLQFAALMGDKSPGAEKTLSEIDDRLLKGTRTYDKKINDYDNKFGTVDGRQPSPYGSPKGIAMLMEKRKRLAKAYENETTESGKKAAYEKYKTNNQALAHAKKTHERVQEGRVDPEKASYNETKAAYKKVVKRHSEAGQKLFEKSRQPDDPSMAIPTDVFLKEKAEAKKEYQKVYEEKIALEVKLNRAKFGN